MTERIRIQKTKASVAFQYMTVPFVLKNYLFLHHQQERRVLFSFVSSPAQWAPCSRHNEERRADGSLCHSMAGPLSQRSLWCLAPSYTPHTQSAQGATLDPAP